MGIAFCFTFVALIKTMVKMQFTRGLLYAALITLSVASCTVSKQVNRLSSEATAAYNSSDYGLAYTLYDSIISLNPAGKKNLNALVYTRGGVAAWEIGENEKSIEFLEQATRMNGIDAKGLFVLAKAYKAKDNLSREIINLETYLDLYNDGNEVDEVRAQLFLAFVRSENWDSSYPMWESVNGAQTKDAELLTGYVLTLNNLDKNDEVLPIAERLLRVKPQSIVGKEAVAIQLYKDTEERYQREMKAYQKNRTSSQYKRLLKQLDTINADFKTARDYLEELYKLNPESRYATYLGNIYTRFDNKSKARYYYNKAKQ